MNYIDLQLAQIETSHLESLTTSLWTLDDRQIDIQMTNILSLRDIVYLEITENNKMIFAVGESKPKDAISRTYPMRYRKNGVEEQIGQLHAYASIQGVYQRMIKRIFVILVTQGLKTFFVSLFILYIIHHQVIRFLIKISQYAQGLNLNKLDVKLDLNRKKSNPPDEVDFLVDAINEMRQRISNDILVQVKTTRDLREKESLLRKIAENYPDSYVSIIEKDLTVGFSSGREFINQGLDPDHYTGMAIEGIFGEQTLFVREKYLKTFDGVEMEFELFINHQYQLYRTAPLTNADGSIDRILVVAQNISEQKKAHERTLTVLDSIDATVYVADMETYEVLFMNNYMKESFGRDLTGETCWKVFRGENKRCTHCTNEQLIDENGTPTGVCVWQDKNPVTGKWYINYDRAIEWADGRLVRLQIATDISNLKRMEEELRQAHKMEAVGTLAGGIAHDFNNVLGIIIGNTELALDDVPIWNPARTFLDEIKTAGLRAKDIVRQLLNFSRKSELEKRPLDIAPIVTESVHLLRASIPSFIHIRTMISDGLSAINADPTQIQQVIINLCTNAAQAMEEEGGALEIGLDSAVVEKHKKNRFGDVVPGNYIQLSVSDTGPGIDPDIQARIFDPYFTTKAVGKGSGMGLSIVHGIVLNHDGGITVNSRPGQGTVINVLFPTCGTGVEIEKVHTDEMPMGCERILLVDDEDAIVKMTGEMLERLGYQVTTKMSPVEALELFQTEPYQFDLIITDMTMPHMTGEKLAAEMIKIRPEIPLILCSGYSRRISKDTVIEIGIKALVNKPIIMADFAKTVRNVLDETHR